MKWNHRLEVKTETKLQLSYPAKVLVCDFGLRISGGFPTGQNKIAKELLGINSTFYIGMTKESLPLKLRFQPLKQQAYLQLLWKIIGFTFVNMVTKTLLYDLSLITAIMK